MEELWQMASRWLFQLGVLPSSSPALSANARVYDLAMALQDGTVLCEACNRLQRGSIPEYNAKAEKQFLQLQNINLVINAILKFGVKPIDVFEDEELFYASNFAKVVNTLSLLSKTPLAVAAGFQSFPKDSERAENKAEEDGEDMYEALEKLVGQSISFSQNSVPLMLPSLDDDDGDATELYGALSTLNVEGSDEIYSDIIYGKKKDEDQQIYGRGIGTADEKRNCALAELLDTEKAYVKMLKSIIEDFMKTVFSNPKTISKGEGVLIFSNIEEIYSTHTVFLSALETQMASHTGRLVSGCFLDAIKSFRCYGKFLCDLTESLAILKELSTKPAVEKVLEQARVASQQRFGLKDLLNVPFQRILKYPLLLKELNKHTPASHADKNGLSGALVAMEDLAKFINDTKKDFDMLKHIVASVKQYTGRPFLQLGSYVKDGDLSYRLQAAKEKPKSRYVFLFANALLICKRKDHLYCFKSAIDLDSMDWEVQDASLGVVGKDEAATNYSFCWTLVGRKGSTVVQHVFGAKTQAFKKKWVADIQVQLQLQRDKKIAPPATLPRIASGMTLKPPLPPSIAKAPLPPPPSTPTTTTSSSAAGKYEQWQPASSPSMPSAPAPPPGSVEFDGADERWFAGRLPRSKADRVLEVAPNGTYLVRESDSRPGDYSLSVKYNLVKHIKINRRGNKYEIAPDAKPFLSIYDLVEHFQHHSLHRHFPGMETMLQIPFRDSLQRPPPQEDAAAGAGIGRARSRFPYSSKSFDELSFDRGVEIVVLSKDETDPGWWKGVLPDGTVGIFPANYVQMLT